MRPPKVIPTSIYSYRGGRPSAPITEEDQRRYVLRNPGGKKKRAPIKLAPLPKSWDPSD